MHGEAFVVGFEKALPSAPSPLHSLAHSLCKQIIIQHVIYQYNADEQKRCSLKIHL
jgi:hypothetical protein